MSNSIEILKNGCGCEFLQLIVNFKKVKNRKNGLYPLCKLCRKDCIF